jgi:16S rRNA (cytidine1402-2'-O)-methyltransferase
VSRELTKKFEENKRGTLEEVCAYYREKGVKGEIVIVVGGSVSKKGMRESVEETEEDN